MVKRKTYENRLKIAAMLAKGMTNKQMAKILHVTPSRINQIRADVKESITEVLEPVYQAQLLASVPLQHRARRVRELVDQGEHLPTVLKTIQYIDSRQFGNTRDSKEAPNVAPIFNLPPGSMVAIKVPDSNDNDNGINKLGSGS